MRKSKQTDGRKHVLPDDGSIQYHGRVVHTSDADGRVQCCFDWPGTEICFVVKGTETVHLEMDGANNFFNLTVGDRRPEILACADGTQEYCIADGLNPAAETRISIYKRTEAVAQFPDRATGCVVLFGIRLGSGGRLVDAPGPPQRVIECVGDSDTAAYGNLGARTGFEVADRCVFADPSKQDASKSWAAFVADAFGAECHNISWSGMGAVWNAPGHGAEGAMDRHYFRLLATQGDRTDTPVSPNNPVLPPVSLVVLYIGGNDWWTLEQRGDAAFVEGYVEFLSRLRQLRADTPLLVLAADEVSGSCLVTPERQQLYSRDMKRVLGGAVEKAGGEAAGIYLREVIPASPIDLALDADWGLMEHWSVPAHRKWARGVTPLIEEIMGWKARAAADMA